MKDKINKTYWVTINHSHDTHYKVELKKHEQLTPEEVGKVFEKLFDRYHLLIISLL